MKRAYVLDSWSRTFPAACAELPPFSTVPLPSLRSSVAAQGATTAGQLGVQRGRKIRCDKQVVSTAALFSRRVPPQESGGRPTGFAD